MRTSLLFLFLSTPLAAGGSMLEAVRERNQLRRASACEWDELFRHGTAECPPCGKTRGTVLCLEGRLPRFKARAASTIWRGKTFHGDGCFVNRWPGFEAVTAGIAPGVSWFDDQPCFVMDYPADSLVFAGLHDEIRRIGPHTWLGRSYVGETREFKGYFLLQEK